MAEGIDCDVPPVGTVLMAAGQRYVLIATSPLQWQSHCPTCGAPLVAKTALRAAAIKRRCLLHHRKGVPVTGRRHVTAKGTT